MAWRVHLTNQAITSLDILPGKPPLLAAWTQRDRATYFDLNTGTVTGEHSHKAVGRHSDKWSEFLAELTAPNGAYLPLVRTAQTTIHTTDDGRLRLYRTNDSRLFLDTDGKELQLETSADDHLVAVGMDGFLGTIAALDEKGKLFLYQQHIAVGAFPTGLKLDPDYHPALSIAHGGAAIFISIGRGIVLIDSSGVIRKHQELHYEVGRMACSPDGKLLVVSDTESSVIRIYNGDDLTPTHQRHAIDLLHEATQIQLIADMPPSAVALGALAITNQGIIAFAMYGVIGVSHIKQMDELPRPQPLL